MRKILCRHERWIARYGNYFLIVRIIMLLYLPCARSSPRRLRSRDIQWKISWIIRIIRYVSSSSRTRYFKCSCFLKQLFETEINRKIKREPALAVGPRSKVFPDGEVPAVITEEEEGSLVTQQDFVGELWAF